MNWVGCYKERSKNLPGHENDQKLDQGSRPPVHSAHSIVSMARSHTMPPDSTDAELRCAPESFPNCRPRADRTDKRNKLQNASTASNVPCGGSLLFVSKTVRLTERVKWVYNSPFRFHIQPLFETFFSPVNIQRLTLQMPAEAHLGVHVAFVIVRFQPQMKHLDKLYLDFPI